MSHTHRFRWTAIAEEGVVDRPSEAVHLDPVPTRLSGCDAVDPEVAGGPLDAGKRVVRRDAKTIGRSTDHGVRTEVGVGCVFGLGVAFDGHAIGWCEPLILKDDVTDQTIEV
jgi:hypothetical protein